MAIINTKLIKYATQARFDIDIAKVPAIIDSKSIVFIENTGRIYAHGKYFGGDWEYLTNKPTTFTPAAHTLGSHSDMALTTLATNNILKWSGSKWVNNTLAQAGIATPADISTAIDNIEIGGRNLMLNTSPILKEGVYSGISTPYLDEGYAPVLNNGVYTVSIYVQGITGTGVGVRLRTYWYVNSHPKVGTLYSQYIYEDGVISFTTNNKPIEANRLYVALVFSSSVSNFPLSYAKLKVEKGNKATDWTPAPEDQVSDWNETNVNSFAFLKNKPTQLSQFTDNIGVASHIANKANPHAVTKAQVGLSNVDNTSDLLKPISNAVQTALNLKFDKTGGRLTAGIGDVNIELWRGTNASWNILNSGGYLRFQSNYTTVVGAYFDALKLDYNTGNALFKGTVTAPTFIGALSGNASSATMLTTLSTYDANDIIGGAAFNYNSPSYWVNAPSGMSYGLIGNIISQEGSSELSLQIAADIVHNSTLSTKDLWFRTGNNLGFQNDWKKFWHSGNLTNLNQLTTRNFSDLQNKPTTLGGYGITDALINYTGQSAVSNIDSIVKYNYIYSPSFSGGYALGTKPTGTDNAVGILNIHTHTGNFTSQLALASSSNKIFMRSTASGVFNAWSELYHTGNLRSNTENDSRYLRIADSITQSVNGLKTFTSNITSAGFVKTGSNNNYTLLGGGGHKLLSDFVDTTSKQIIYGGKEFRSSSSSVTPITITPNGAGVDAALVINPTSNFGYISFKQEKDVDKDTLLFGKNSNGGYMFLKYTLTGMVGTGRGDNILALNPDGTAVFGSSVKATSFIGKATSAGDADTANGQKFNWSNTSDTPAYLWATSANGTAFLASRANISVKYADSAGSITGFTSGWSNSGEHNANNISSNGMWYYTSNGPTTAQGSSTNDGALYSQAHSTTWVAQIAQDYRNGRLFVRGKNNGTWQSWLNILDSGNSSVSGNTIKINGTSTTWVDTHRAITNTYTGSDQTTSVSQYGTNAMYNALLNGNANTLGTLSKESFLPFTIYSFATGCLVKTDIPQADSAMCVAYIKGYGYAGNTNTQVTFYSYANSSIINASGIHYGDDIGPISVFVYDGVVCLWFKQKTGNESFQVTVNYTSTTNTGNRVTSITNVAMPATAERTVNIVPKQTALTTSTVSSALSLVNAGGTSISLGSATQPVYFSGGKPVAATAYANAVVASAAVLTTARTIGGVSFNGSGNINLPGVNVAGTQSTSGNAATATALTTNAGSLTQPIYFSGGKPVATTHSLGTSVPTGAVFTDTNTWRGIVDSLVSTSTVDSLSANQGRLLATGSARDNTKLALSGGTMTGILTAQSNVSYTTSQVRNISSGTAAPSGGNNGDIYIQLKS